MSAKSRSAIAFITALPFLIAPPLLAPALAQTGEPRATHAPPVRHARPQIEVTPGQLLYRRCTSWLELQYRPSGTVLYPQYRCWWVRG